jgi:hypothetical protein
MSKQKSLSAGRPSAKKNAATLASLVGKRKKRINFEISEADHRAFKVYAAKHGKTITEILVDHVARLVNE